MLITLNIQEKEIQFNTLNIHDTDILKSLECSICLRIFIHPVSIPCQHNFCGACLNNYIDTFKKDEKIKCALCRREFTCNQVCNSNALNNILSTIIVKCVQTTTNSKCKQIEQSPLKRKKYNDEENLCCNMEMKLDMVSQHIQNSCQFWKHQCKFCKEEFTLNNLKEHLAQICVMSPDYTVYCEMCGKELKRGKLKRHQTKYCEQRVVNCLFEKFGCNVKVRFCHMPIHNRRKAKTHVDLVNEYIEGLENENIALRETCEKAMIIEEFEAHREECGGSRCHVCQIFRKNRL